MNGPDVPDDLQRLYHLLASREPRDLSSHIASIEYGRPMIAGTTVPALGATDYRSTDSGLLVPATAVRNVAPIDLIKTFITPDEISGQPLSEAVAWAQLEKLSIADVISFVASTLCRWRSPGVAPSDNDRYFAEAWFEGSTKNVVLNLLRGESRGLIAPQALLVLLKMAFVVHGRARSEDVAPGNLVVGLLAVMQNLGAGANVSEDQVLYDTPGALGREVISNQLFNSSVEVAGVLARYVRRWTELPSAYADDPRIVDVSKIYRDYTHVDLQDLAIVGIALIAGSWQGRVEFSEDYFSSLNWDSDRLYRVLDLISCDVAGMQAVVVEEIDKHGLQWAFSTFERYPLIKMGNSSYCLIDPLLILRRIFGWLPVFDVTFRLSSINTRESLKLKDQFLSSVRHFAEVYALEVIRSIVRPGVQTRVYEEGQIRSAYGKIGVRIADCAIDYGDAWVVVEITTSQLTRESVSGVSDEHVMSDIEKLVGKVEQIDSTINAIRNDEHRLTGSLDSSTPRFFPVLVVTEGFPVNPVSLHLLRQKVADANYLRSADIAELEVLDTAELELVEAVVESGGPSFREILEMKGSSNLYRASVRDYILVERELSPNFSHRVLQLSEKVFQPALEALAESSPKDSVDTD